MTFLREFLIGIAGKLLVFVAFLFILFTFVKFFLQSTVITQGTVIAVSSGPITDCIEVSKTTVGESSIVRFCVYDDVELPKIKDYVEITFKTSPFLFMDSVTVKQISK